MNCTQEDLLQVLQKLMNERQKVKLLEKKIALGDPLTAISYQNSEEHEKEIQGLKTTISELREKLKVVTAPSPNNNDESEREILVLKNIINDLNQKLLAAQTITPTQIPTTKAVSDHAVKQELQSAKERNLLLEEEIKRLKQFHLSLQAELKEQSTKNFENDRLQSECKRHKEEIDRLESELQKIKNLPPEVRIEKMASVEEKLHIERLERELEDKKLLFSELATKNKELEAKISVHLTEKLSTLSRLQEFSQQTVNKDELYHKQLLEKELLVQSMTAQIDTLSKEKKELQNSLETQNEQEIALKKERQENQRLQAMSIEDKSQIELLEQHLARRVKECTLLTSKQEEHLVELRDKEKKLAALSEELHAAKLREEKMTETFSRENELLEQECSDLQAQIQELEEEVSELRPLEEKYLQLEELCDQFGSLMTKKSVQKPIHKPSKTVRKERATPTSAPTISHDMFSYQKEVSAKRHDLFE